MLQQLLEFASARPGVTVVINYQCWAECLTVLPATAEQAEVARNIKAAKGIIVTNDNDAPLMAYEE